MGLFYQTSTSYLCCGALQFGRYSTFNNGYNKSKLDGKELDNYSYGHAEFCNEPSTLKRNKQAYEELKTKFKLVYQSAPRINKNHGGTTKNLVFMCVYLPKDS